MKTLLDIPFKGSRNYIHGSDIFNAINQALPELFTQKSPYISQLSFTAFSYHLCSLVFDETVENAMGKGIIALNDSTKKSFHLVETEKSPVSRQSFDEEDLLHGANYSKNSIMLTNTTKYSTIEIVIALTKALSYKNMPLENGKWVFGRIDLTDPLPEVKQDVIIKCIASVAGRFNINTIEIDGKKIGKIQFIVGTP